MLISVQNDPARNSVIYSYLVDTTEVDIRRLISMIMASELEFVGISFKYYDDDTEYGLVSEKGKIILLETHSEYYGVMNEKENKEITSEFANRFSMPVAEFNVFLRLNNTRYTVNLSDWTMNGYERVDIECFFKTPEEEDIQRILHVINPNALFNRGA